jgi:hypothetical protein
MRVSQQSFDAIADRLPIGRDTASVQQRIEVMERLLERLFVVPVLNRPIGLDVILDVVPVVGDLIGAILGAYIVWEARNLGMSKWHLARMAGNVGIDFLLGSIPWIGAIPDFLFRSNSRNLRIIRKWIEKNQPAARTIEGQLVRS